ncbi:MAG: FHA domain-containing protein [Verrucomicrobiota bacterium]
MDKIGHQLIQTLAAQEEEYLLTLISPLGTAEFLCQQGRFCLLNKAARNHWKEILTAPSTRFEIRPNLTPKADDGLVIPNEVILAGTSHSPLNDPKEFAPESDATMTIPDDTLPGALTAETEKISSQTASEAYAENNNGNGYKPRTFTPGVDNKADIAVIYIDAGRHEPLWVGRTDDCEMVIHDQSISRRHCQIQLRGTELFIVDNDSTNGSYIGGSAISEAKLKAGQFFYLGKVLCMVKVRKD